jgi:hypothetical protein
MYNVADELELYKTETQMLMDQNELVLLGVDMGYI